MVSVTCQRPESAPEPTLVSSTDYLLVRQMYNTMYDMEYILDKIVTVTMWDTVYNTEETL